MLIYKNVNEYVKDEIIKIVFAKSAEYDSNILTKVESYMRST